MPMVGLGKENPIGWSFQMLINFDELVLFEYVARFMLLAQSRLNGMQFRLLETNDFAELITTCEERERFN